MANKLHSLSAQRAEFTWGTSAREIDMATPPAKPVPLESQGNAAEHHDRPQAHEP